MSASEEDTRSFNSDDEPTECEMPCPDESSEEDDGVELDRPIDYNDPFFTESQERTCKIFVDNHILYASKEMLASVSPVFKRILYGDEKDDDSECNDKGVELKDKTLTDALEFFHVLFSIPLRKQISGRSFKVLVEFADEYDIVQLKVDCGEFLKKRFVDLRMGDEAKLMEILQPAAKFRLVNVVEKCVPYLAALPPPIFDNYKNRLPLYVRTAALDAKVKRREAEQHSWAWQGKRFTKVCPFCSAKTRAYCQKCWMCKNHKLIKCQAFHDIDCRASEAHAERCRFLEVDKVSPELKICTCGAIKCLCGFVDFDKDILNM